MTMGTMPRLLVSSALIQFLEEVSCRRYGAELWPRKQKGAGLAARRLWEAKATQLAAAINSSKGRDLSVTLADASTNSVTLFSTTTASTSAMRSRSLRYQRITSAGFS